MDWHELKRWLSSLPAETLAAWLIDASVGDPSLARVLRCEAAQAAAGGLDAEAMRSAIDSLTEVPPGVTWRESDRIGDRIDLVVGLLTRALDRGHAGGVVELTEHALRRTELAIMEVQDSEYWSSRVLDALSALHRRACEIARPDPVGLATRWFELRWKSPLGLHHGFPELYRDVLGATGLATLDSLVETALASHPTPRSRHGPDHGRAELGLLREDLRRLRETSR